MRKMIKTFHCEQCHQLLLVSSDFSGKLVKCPICSACMVVPCDFENTSANHVIDNRISTIEFNILKERLNARCVRVLIRYAWWGLLINFALAIIPFFLYGMFFQRFLILILLLIFIILGNFARRNWQTEPDESLIFVGLTFLLYYGYLASTLGCYGYVLLLILIMIVLLAWLRNSSFVMDRIDSWGEIIGKMALLFCLPLVGIISAKICTQGPYFNVIRPMAEGNRIVTGLMICVFLVWTFFNLAHLAVDFTRWLYHAWNNLCREDNTQCISPEIKAGLLWVPIFNLVWMFVALGTLPHAYKHFFAQKNWTAEESFGDIEMFLSCICNLMSSLLLISILVDHVAIKLLGYRLFSITSIRTDAVVFCVSLLAYYLGLGWLGKATDIIHIISLRTLK